MSKETTTVKDLIANIAETRTQVSANSKDELRVAQAMLNDPTYKVDIYTNKGVVGQYCPYDEARRMCASIIKDTTRMSAKEAEELAYNYKFDKASAQTMVNFGKEFINTYVKTGRKLPLGGRERCNAILQLKTKEARMVSVPSVSVNEDGGTVIHHGAGGTKMVPEHDVIKATGGVPKWIK